MKFGAQRERSEQSEKMDLSEVNTNQTNLILPQEIWVKILMYLRQNDIISFKQCCSLFNAIANQGALDIYWQPHLNRLHEIDPSMSALPPKAIAESPVSRTDRMKRTLQGWAEQQLEESSHFKKQAENNNGFNFLWRLPSKFKVQIQELLEKQRTIEAPAQDAQSLLQRQEELEALNKVIIESKVNAATGILNISSMQLTRISESLWEDPKLRKAFQSLRSLNLTKNKIGYLPTFLEKCPSLQEIICDHNRLKTVPEWMTKKFGQPWHDKVLENQDKEQDSLAETPSFPLSKNALLYVLSKDQNASHSKNPLKRKQDEDTDNSQDDLKSDRPEKRRRKR